MIYCSYLRYWPWGTVWFLKFTLKLAAGLFMRISPIFYYYIPLPFNILQGSQSSISTPSSSSSSVPQKVPSVVAATGTGSTSEQERKLKQYLDDERIALFLQNEEFMKELQRNREFLIALERGRKTLAHTLNGTMSSFWHTPLPLLSQFHLHKSWRVHSYANLLNPAVNVAVSLQGH